MVDFYRFVVLNTICAFVLVSFIALVVGSIDWPQGKRDEEEIIEVKHDKKN